MWTNRKCKPKLRKYIVHLIACHHSKLFSRKYYCKFILNKFNINRSDFIHFENIAGKGSRKRKEHNKHITGTSRNSNKLGSIINKYDGTKYIHRKTDLLDGCVWLIITAAKGSDRVLWWDIVAVVVVAVMVMVVLMVVVVMVVVVAVMVVVVTVVIAFVVAAVVTWADWELLTEWGWLATEWRRLAVPPLLALVVACPVVQAPVPATAANHTPLTITQLSVLSYAHLAPHLSTNLIVLLSAWIFCISRKDAFYFINLPVKRVILICWIAIKHMSITSKNDNKVHTDWVPYFSFFIISTSCYIISTSCYIMISDTSNNLQIPDNSWIVLIMLFTS